MPRDANGLTPKQARDLKAGRAAIRRMKYWDGIWAHIDSLPPLFEYEDKTDPKTGITTRTPKPVAFAVR